MTVFTTSDSAQLRSFARIGVEETQAAFHSSGATGRPCLGSGLATSFVLFVKHVLSILGHGPKFLRGQLCESLNALLILLFGIQNHAMPYVGKPARTGRGIQNDRAARNRERFVVALSGIWHEGGFVQQVAPGMVTTNLAGTAGNAKNSATVGKAQCEIGLACNTSHFLLPPELLFV